MSRLARANEKRAARQARRDGRVAAEEAPLEDAVPPEPGPPDAPGPDEAAD
jgi:hypothetical protein